jgi:hypothetical protein
MADPTNSEQVEAVDHREEATRLLQASADLTAEVGGTPTVTDALQAAQIHTQLALVDEVAKLREAIHSGPGCLADRVEYAINVRGNS